MPITYDVADGVHLLEHARVNCYLVQDDDGITLVDAGLPPMWSLLQEALQHLGRPADSIRAVVLTHGHFDHVGFASRLHRDRGVPVFVHPGDARLAAHPYQYRPQRNRVLYLLGHPGGWAPIARMAAAGALSVKGVADTVAFDWQQTLDVPGRPLAVATPGHTDGHTCLVLPERDVALCGDALVTFDPYTGVTGPQVVATAATNDGAVALQSLDAIAETGVGTLLSGHGDPWLAGAAEAVAEARRVGVH